MSRVLVTGALGNVGRHVVRALDTAGHEVIATDLDSEATRRWAIEFETDAGIDVRFLDLTDADAVAALVRHEQPDAVIHLAALIPPATYKARDLAYAVNVTATQTLCHAVEACGARLIFASSIAVYGARPPGLDPVGDRTPVAPVDAYGADKVAAEALVTRLCRRWVILRLGAVVFPELDLAMDWDSIYLEGLLPGNARLQSVDARDVATALVNAVSAPCESEILLIGGDDTHRMTQAELSATLTAAVGMRGLLPKPLDGDPADPSKWFVVDWMDTRRAQELLDFQHHTWSQTVADVRRNTGIVARLAPLGLPLLRWVFARRSPYRGLGLEFADPWAAIERRWGPRAFEVGGKA